MFERDSFHYSVHSTLKDLEMLLDASASCVCLREMSLGPIVKMVARESIIFMVNLAFPSTPHYENFS